MFLFIFQLILFVSLFRSTGKRFDVAYGAGGCLASGVCILLGTAVLMSLFGLDLIPVKAQNGLGLLMGFLCLSLGGYIAARLGRTTGWTNSLIVGIFFVIFLLAMLLDKIIEPDFGLTYIFSEKLIAIYEKPWAYWGRLPGRLFDQLIEMLQEPLTNWEQLAGLVFAIPAAVLGGFLWQSMNRN